MKSILIAILFVLVSAPAFAGNENVEYCKTLAHDTLDCKAVFAPCVGLENAQDRAEKKDAAWRAVCSFDIVDLGACATLVGTDNPDFCKCMAEQADCSKPAVGKCVAFFAAKAQEERQTQRLLDAFSSCF